MFTFRCPNLFTFMRPLTYGDFNFGVAAKYGFDTDDRSNAGVKVNATYAF